MDKKVCTKCEVKKELNEFYFRKDSGKYRNKCKACITKNNSKRISNIRKQKRELKEKSRITHKNCDGIYKTCNKCWERKKIIDFYYRKDNKTFRPECKLCFRVERGFDPNKKIVEQELEKNRVCRKCGIKKELISDYFEFRSDTKKYRTECKVCRKKYLLQYLAKNPEKVLIWAEKSKKRKKESGKKYYQKNKEKIKQYFQQWKKDNPEKYQESCRKSQKKWYAKNRKEILATAKQKYWNNLEYQRERSREYRERNIEEIKKRRAARARKYRKINPFFKLKENVSRAIRLALFKSGGSKNGQSINNYLPYTIAELKQHLESQFENWMNWDNYGSYRISTWDDNDQSTWKWQLDHIIPQSKLKYDSMEYSNFLKCWALENLRPYSAKQNFLDGADRPIDKRNM